MPLRKGASEATKRANFEEFGAGKTYAKTRKKHVKRKADKQRIAVVLSKQRESKKTRKPSR